MLTIFANPPPSIEWRQENSFAHSGAPFGLDFIWRQNPL